jgi:inosine/xanthosine triphosphatase
MKRIVVASQNPVKIDAVRAGFELMFPEDDFSIDMVSVSSDVDDQPVTDSETLLGAQNRARNACRVVPEADYWVGIEGGVEDITGEMAAFAWIVVKSGDIEGKGRTGTFFLPIRVAELIRQGKELGEADDIVFNRTNSKQDNGAIGILTANAVDRTQLYQQGVMMSLVVFKNPNLYLPRED